MLKEKTINNINQYFKQTMEHFKIKGVDLARELDCLPGYISDIRVGKINPPTNRLWELIEIMERLAPGARRYFGNLVAGNDTDYFLEAVVENIEPADMLELMSSQQLSKFMFALAAKLGKVKLDKQEQNKKSVKTEQEDLMLIG